MGSRLIQRCRSCGGGLHVEVCDLGMQPLSNAYVRPENIAAPETFYPLRVVVCDSCWLMQTVDVERRETLFADDYPYFSSVSPSWVEHARIYADDMISRLDLTAESLVVEIASNDGYLLQHFVARNVPSLGIEPAAGVAKAAVAKGVPTRVAFFGHSLAEALKKERGPAALIVGNNVLAHVPNLNDFVAGLAALVAPDGVVTLEFPHLLKLLNGNQFDTIYHEHFSYISLVAFEPLLARHGLRLFDVRELKTHGGSLRAFICRAGTDRETTTAVGAVRAEERRAGLDSVRAFAQFTESVRETKRALLELLIKAKRAGKNIAAYGAAAKGNTLLNYCGIGRDFIEFVADLNPEKHGKFLPGSRIPILDAAAIFKEKPDLVLLLPWNLKDEITAQLHDVRSWGGQFVIPIPVPLVLP